MKRPNIIFYFSDQQRWDTVTPDLTPNLEKLASEGVKFTNSFTCQPVCGPARACLQTGVYATQNKCYWNGIPLPENTKPLAEYFNEAGYDTAYIGKWHLASDRLPGIGLHCESTAVPKNKQGGYKYWRAADVLEFTSHGYDGYVFDGDGNKIDFTGYRADCINDFALEYLDKRDKEKPFFMFVSQLEPHHQNDRHCYEGPKETVENYRDYPIPDDLTFMKGDYKESYPDYIAAINRLDENVGRLVQKLKDIGEYENTVIVYTSDHGSHFKTRNLEYKRSCHDSCTHTPLIIFGGGFKGGKIDERLVSLIDLPPTLLKAAGIEIPESYEGNPLQDETERDHVFIQISESQVGRAIRTKKYKYSVRALGVGYVRHSSPVYHEDFLYDLEKDPIEKHNLIKDPAYKQVRKELKQMLIKQMTEVGEKKPLILPKL
ncbi:MAG: sulfatase-like hydrolase/transferase [Clostridia bacterium]|nr:sulfatase-like hydrolase/transferase [Clostridia bacterium]